MTNKVRFVLVVAAYSTALSTQAIMTDFSFSYLWPDGTVSSGTLTGDWNGDLVTESEITEWSLDGVVQNVAPNVSTVAWSDYDPAATVSISGATMDLIASFGPSVATLPYIVFANGVTGESPRVEYYTSSTPQVVSAFDPARWSLQQVSQLSDAGATVLMLSAILAGIVGARRRTQA